ncbi:hypothetical protein BCR44DRAFT_118174 [Catenaria anguillulae PL171]|uniref:Centrosomal protein CEP104 Zn finger domain-containing protein n=1 Tax=Catenaria anguillulae PL171 TaxID=765915 RepID=A0A1Y2HJT8_9FUNG|nr:hypothetical protein BCR44DRAFT_118174 [Catenaria anguillulae PL171]
MSTASAAPGGPSVAGGQANETEGDWNLDFTCVFCEEVNPEFVQQRLDEHYWRECPCLCACAYCSEVVEVANMHTHLKLECKSPQAKGVQLPADTCVMCRAKVGLGEAAFRRHLLVGSGCAKAVRKPKLGVKYRL